MTDDFVVWGARKDGVWRVELGKPSWSFDRSELERRILPYAGDYEIVPLPDHLVARIPEAAEALVRWLTIRKLRREAGVEGEPGVYRYYVSAEEMAGSSYVHDFNAAERLAEARDGEG